MTTPSKAAIERANEIAENLTEGEKSRLLMGRTDWREDDWQDHCGDPNCDHCTGWVDQNVNPNRLSEHDQALRAALTAAGIKIVKEGE